MSPLLAQLDSSLRSVVDATERSELLARKSCALARIGRYDDARQIVDDLRSAYGDGRDGRISVWIMLAEGLILWFSELSPAAADRIARAQFLSGAMKYSTMIALASAWKAHIEFETSKFESMIGSVGTAIDHAEMQNVDARARISVVLCSSFALCGDRTKAQFWFLQGRDYALKAGDQASIEALQFNRAVLLVAALRADSCIAELQVNDIRTVRLEFESARNLQALTHIETLDNHGRLSEARLLMLEKRYAEAIAALRAVRDRRPFANYHFNTSLLDLEVAFCTLKLRGVEDALNLFCDTDASTFTELDVDDQLAAAWMQHQMAIADKRFGFADDYHACFDKLAKTYEASRQALSVGLQSVNAERLQS